MKILKIPIPDGAPRTGVLGIGDHPGIGAPTGHPTYYCIINAFHCNLATFGTAQWDKLLEECGTNEVRIMKTNSLN